MTEKEKSFIKRNKYRKTPLGRCVICGKPSPWNEEKGHYERLCSDKCKREYVKLRNERVKEKYGTSNLADIAEFQRDKLMANRTIAKPYTHTDGTVYNVLSKLEFDALRYLDKTLHLPSSDIEAPMSSAPIKYKYHGTIKRHYPDIYIKSLNLIISIKDGMDNPNRHPNFKKDREKNIAIYKSILTTSKYNYMQIEGKEVTVIDELLKSAIHLIKSEHTRFILPPRIDFVMYNESCYNACEEVSKYNYLVFAKDNDNNLLGSVFVAHGIQFDDNLYTIYKSGFIRIDNIDDIDVTCVIRDISSLNIKYEDIVSYMQDNNINDMFNTLAGIVGYPIEDPEGTLQEEYDYIKDKSKEYIPITIMDDELELDGIIPLHGRDKDE